ncbi:MAG: OstA-like protein [Flavobacteriaceae bacterium]|nr:OstA-like protein [Flavobacteriaceae bacterium]
MEKRFLSIIFTFFALIFNAQIRKDSFFEKSQKKKGEQSQKVKIINADITQKNPNVFNGNTFMVGNVHLEHQGSTLKADTVVHYSEENFVKAIGNIRLKTHDGNTITAEEMEYDANTERGIARKNVVLTDPKQSIKTEELYYDKISNTAYFTDGGTIFNGSNTIWTKTGTYDINTNIVDVSGNVNIDNEQHRVEGSKIIQNQNTNTAEFLGPTKVINKKNPANYVYTEKGQYKMSSKEVFLNRNSRIHYNGKVLTGDEMYFDQNKGFGTAKGNVLLNDPKEKRFIKGGYGEIFEQKDSAMITEKPYAVKIFKKDSLYFSAERILTFQRKDKNQNKKSYLRAFRKVRIFKSNMQGRADSLSFNETDGELHLNREPILWMGQKQVSGDTIKAYFNTEIENLDSLKVVGNAFAISKVDSLNLKDEFNQVKGKLMSVFLKENEINIIKVLGNAQSIIYAENEDAKTKVKDRIGIAFSTCGEIETLFEDKKVYLISCNIDANTDVYPMSKTTADKKKFPDFNWNTKDRPRRWQDIFLDTPNNEDIFYE